MFNSHSLDGAGAVGGAGDDPAICALLFAFAYNGSTGGACSPAESVILVGSMIPLLCPLSGWLAVAGVDVDPIANTGFLRFFLP